MRIRAYGIAILASTFILAIGARDGLAEEAVPPQANVRETSGSGSKTLAPGSLLVHVDPRTLELSLTPSKSTVPLELTTEILNGLDTSFEGLTASVKSDGTLYDLKGRFQGVWLAVTDSSGQTKPFCLTSLPPPVAAAARALRERKEARRER